MNLAKVENFHGEQLLFGRLLAWAKDTDLTVSLVSADGVSIRVSRALLQFLSPMLLNINNEYSDNIAVIITPISGEELTVVGNILDLNNKDHDLVLDEEAKLFSE